MTCMMTSWTGNAFRITDPFWGGFTGHRWILPTKMHQKCGAYDVIFVVNMRKTLNKASSYRRVETPWRLCDVTTPNHEIWYLNILNSVSESPTANYVGPNLAQRGSCRLHIGPTWAQRALLSGMIQCLSGWEGDSDITVITEFVTYIDR